MQVRKSRGRGKKALLGERERRQLAQLAVCLLLFAAAFLGRGVFPGQTEQLRSNLLEIIQRDTDFSAVFSRLGQAVAEEAPVLETLDDVWVGVFGGTQRLSSGPERAALEAMRAEARKTDAQHPWSKAELPPAPILPPEPEVKQTPAQRDLGLAETATPVLGVLTSGFGVREHPIDGEVKMHEGLDLAADLGEDVLAFAAGTVDYIGESPAYGQYLQLRHANGVTTFYAHCSKLCVQKGQTVAKGEVVAKVGQTGNATGPHLHFEIKKDGAFTDPSPYINYLTE